MKEIWKDIPTWEGIYQCSNYGRVYNLITKHYLKGNKYKSGYYQIVLSYKGKEERWLLHRLVATVWQRPLLEIEDAHHKNHFRFCNCCWNIQIVDSKQHAKEHGEERKGIFKHSQQTKRKMSNNKKGHVTSQQTKRKISETLKRLKQQ